MPGLTAPAIKNKLALRASITGSVFMDNVQVPADALLPKSSGLGSPFSCLNNARFGISWGVVGALEDCIARTRDYALERYVLALSTDSCAATSVVLFRTTPTPGGLDRDPPKNVTYE